MPASEIKRIRTKREKTYDRFLGEIEARTALIAQLTVEIEDINLSLGRFQDEFAAKVAPKYLELERLQIEIEQVNARIERYLKDPTQTAAQIERVIRRRVTFDKRWQSLEDDKEAINRNESNFEKEAKIVKESSVFAAEIHKVYLELVKMYHPDLAKSEIDRTARESAMQQINELYHRRDLESLKSFSSSANQSELMNDERPLDAKLEWARQEIARLDQVVNNLRTEIASLRSSPTYELWKRSQRDDVIGDLESDLEHQIVEKQACLKDRVRTYSTFFGTDEAFE